MHLIQEKLFVNVYYLGLKFMSCFPLPVLGVYIINLKKTWEKLLLAARAIVAIENPADVCVISSRNTGQVTRWTGAGK